MTPRIYYTDPYCRTFDAVITKSRLHEGRPAVLLDRTAFYPTSGGQPFDVGWLRADDQRIEVIETTEVDDDVVHIVGATLTEGMAIRGEVDWTRRFDHMQQHTGQHILSAAFDRLFENPTVSFHMGSEVSTIDLRKATSWPDISRAEGEANRIIWEDREVAIRFVSSQHATTLPLRKEPAREGTLRLIEVKDFDLSACGGTHVSSTGAIGALVVTAAEKFKGGTRVTFVCGGRAIRAFQGLRDAVAGSVRLLSVLPHELPAAIERLQTETKDLARTRKKFQEALASHEAARLLEASRASGAGEVRVIVEALDGWDAHGLKAIATNITSNAAAAVALFSNAPSPAVVIARSSGVDMDATAILRGLMERVGGRGGGQPDLAQGGGLGGSLSEMIAAARQLLQGLS